MSLGASLLAAPSAANPLAALGTAGFDIAGSELGGGGGSSASSSSDGMFETNNQLQSPFIIATGQASVSDVGAGQGPNDPIGNLIKWGLISIVGISAIRALK